MMSHRSHTRHHRLIWANVVLLLYVAVIITAFLIAR